MRNHSRCKTQTARLRSPDHCRCAVAPDGGCQYHLTSALALSLTVDRCSTKLPTAVIAYHGVRVLCCCVVSQCFVHGYSKKTSQAIRYSGFCCWSHTPTLSLQLNKEVLVTTHCTNLDHTRLPTPEAARTAQLNLVSLSNSSPWTSARRIRVAISRVH